MNANYRAQLGALGVPTQAGGSTLSRLLNSVRTGYIRMELTGTVTIAAGGATTVLNGGRLSSFLNQILFFENGNPLVQRDARSMSRVTELLGMGPSGNINLTAVGAAVQQLRETILVPFAWPLAVNPWETCFVAIDPNAVNTVGYTFNPLSLTNGIGVIATSANAVTLSNFNVNIVQVFDYDTQIRPLYRPYMIDYLMAPITGNVADLPFYIDYPDILRSLAIQQDSNLGLVGDIITGYQLRSDTVQIDGTTGDLNFQDYVQQQMLDYGGAFSEEFLRLSRNVVPLAPQSIDPSLLLRNFQTAGRLSNTLVKAQWGQTPRILITGAPSGVAGVTSSFIRAGMDRLQKVPGVTSATNHTSTGQAVPV